MPRASTLAAAALATVALAVPLRPAVVWAVSFDEALAASGGLPGVHGLQRALDARRTGDAALPSVSGNPELMVGVGPAVPGPVVSALLGVSQSWLLGDLPGARRDAARAEREVLAAEVRARLLQSRLAVAEAWLRLWSHQQALLLAEREVTLAVQLADTATRSAAKGVVTQADAAEARLYAAEARLEALRLEGVLRAMAGELARWSGLPPLPPPRADGPLPRPQLPDATGWQVRTAMLEQLPPLAVARLQVTAQRAREVEAAAAAASGMVLGGQLQHDPQGNTALVATLGLRWAAFDRGQRSRAQAREATERALAEAAESTLAGRQQLALVWHEVEYARDTEAVLRDSLVPAADALLQSRELAARRGVATVFEVIRARRARLEAERLLVMTQGQRAWAEVKAWLLLAALEVR